MKYFLSIIITLFFAALAQANVVEADSCGQKQHECECATGTYCLNMGEACMTPETSCPAHVSDSTASSCGTKEHECICATGSYCVRIGYACPVPTVACPSAN